MSGYFGILLILGCLALRPALADDETVSFCYNEWPPYAVLSDGIADGISIRIIRRAGELLEKNVEFLEMKWSECLRKVKDGEIDAVIDAAMRPEYLQGPTSFSLFTDTFWVRNDSKIYRYSDMRNGRIGLVKDYNYNDALLELLRGLGLDVHYKIDDPSNIRSLSRGEVDTIIADLASTFDFVKRNRLNLHPILPPFSVDSLYLSFSIDRVDLQREFDRVFSRLLEEGFVDSVYEEVIGTSYSSFQSAQ